MRACAATRRLDVELGIALWLAYVCAVRFAAIQLELERTNLRLGVGLVLLVAIESAHALPVIGAGSARVLLGASFFFLYASWTSLPAVHRAYANVAAALSVPRGDAYSIVTVRSDGMEPAIAVGALAVVDFSAYRYRSPRIGDVVAVAVAPNRVYLKRLVAKPGDRFEVDGLGVLRNGRRPRGWTNRAFPDYTLGVAQDTIEVNGVPLDRSIADVPLPAAWNDPARLPDNCYFVLGDNVNDSEDSHVFGCVPRRAIVGQAIRVL
jgi:signal peptidase I